MSYLVGPSALLSFASGITQVSDQVVVTNSESTSEIKLTQSPDITNIDFSKVKYFKKIDHDGNIIKYSKDEIVAYRDKLYYAMNIVSSTQEPFENSKIWKELRNVPNRKIVSTTKPTGYLRSGDQWYNPTTNKSYRFQNIKNYHYWISD